MACPSFRFEPETQLFTCVLINSFRKLQLFRQIYELTTAQLRQLIEEFGWIAENWRLYLDEHDKNDLVHVRVK